MISLRPVLTWAFLSAMAVLFFALGCGDDPTRPCTFVAAGRLQGVVRMGGTPTDAVIMATRVNDEVQGEATFETSPGESGAYLLDLPAGDYIVQLRPGISHRYIYDYSAAGLGYGQLPPDTLRVDDSRSPVVVDFTLGSLTLHLELSDHLEGESASIELYKRDAIETGQWRTYLNQGEGHIENGQVDIQAVGLLPGEYKVEIVLGRRVYLCNCPYDGEHFWMPGIREESESPWYEVVADSVVALTCSIPTEPARIEGRISGAWLSMGLGVAPELSIVNPDSVIIMGQRRVGDDGRFGVDVHLPGPVKLLVTQDGIEQWIGGAGFTEATLYDLQLGETITNIDLVQSGLRLNIEGDVQFSPYGTEIRIHDPMNMELLGTSTYWSWAGSVVPVCNLWPGEYIVHISPDGSDHGGTAWRPQWFDRVTDPAEANLISIGSPGEVVRLDVTLERGGTIAGELEFSSPASGWHYVVVTTADQYLCWGADLVFEGNREYLLQGLPDGSYRVGVVPRETVWRYGTPPPAGTTWYPGTGNWDAAETVEILDAADLVGLNIPME